MDNARLINQTSGDVEYYTPVKIIEAARQVLGTIDLDPASCEEANTVVKATHFYTRADNGLAQPWFGNIWMNHPFGRTANPDWMRKLKHERALHRINQCICITFAATSERWFQWLLAFPQCFLTPRTNYWTRGGQPKRGVTKGSVVTYVPGVCDNSRVFAEVFQQFGRVK